MIFFKYVLRCFFITGKKVAVLGLGLVSAGCVCSDGVIPEDKHTRRAVNRVESMVESIREEKCIDSLSKEDQKAKDMLELEVCLSEVARLREQERKERKDPLFYLSLIKPVPGSKNHDGVFGSNGKDLGFDYLRDSLRIHDSYFLFDRGGLSDFGVDTFCEHKKKSIVFQLTDSFYRNFEERFYNELDNPDSDGLVRQFDFIFRKLELFSDVRCLCSYDMMLFEEEQEEFLKRMVKLMQGAGKDALKEFLEKRNLEEIAEIAALELKEKPWLDSFKLRKVGVKLRTARKGDFVEVEPEFYVAFGDGRVVKLSTHWFPFDHYIESKLRLRFGKYFSFNGSIDFYYRGGDVIKEAEGVLNFNYNKNTVFSCSYNHEGEDKKKIEERISAQIIFIF